MPTTTPQKFYNTSPRGRLLNQSADRLAGVAEKMGRSVFYGGSLLRDAHRPAARLLLAAAARSLPDDEHNDFEPPIRAIHDLLEFVMPISAIEKADRAQDLRRMHRDLARLMLIVASELDDMGAGGSPFDDWCDVRDWLRELTAEERPDQYSYDFSEYQEQGLSA